MHIRHFTIPHDGLVFIGLGIGSVIATLMNIWFLRPYPQLMKEWRGFPPPEMRLSAAMVGTPLLAVSIFLLGWTGNYESVPWYVPALTTIPLGTGIVLVFMSFLVRSTRPLLPYRNAILTIWVIRVTSSTPIECIPHPLSRPTQWPAPRSALHSRCLRGRCTKGWESIGHQPSSAVLPYYYYQFPFSFISMAHGYVPGASFLRLKYVFRITLAVIVSLTSPDHRTLR